jgi:hypothetical protein
MNLGKPTLEKLVALGCWAIREGVTHIEGLDEFMDDQNYAFTPTTGTWVHGSRRKTRSALRPDADPTCYSFEQFYADYGYKRDKHTAAQLWRKLTEKDRVAIKRALPMYKEDSLVKGEQAEKGVFIPHRQLPSTFINKRTWMSYEEEKYMSRHQKRYDDYLVWCGKNGFDLSVALTARQFDHYIDKVIPKYGAQEAQARFVSAHTENEGDIYATFLNKI